MARSLRFSALALALLGVSTALKAQAGQDVLAELFREQGQAALGGVMQVDVSPYRDGGTRRDLLPLYLYEGEHLFLRGDRIGWKVDVTAPGDVEIFLRRRLEGHPVDAVPESLEGMALRRNGADIGVAWRGTLGPGTLRASALHDLSGVSDGSELSLSYQQRFEGARWALVPAAGLSWRSADLNDYYYGVRADEATTTRPAYRAGSGVDTWLGLFGSYSVTANWRAIGGVTLTQRASTVRRSPVVDGEAHPTFFAGAAYDFGSHRDVAWSDGRSPLIVRVFYGAASEDRCHLARIVQLACTDFNRDEPTELAGIHVGRVFIEGFRGWKLDVVGYAGVVHHRDRPYQGNGTQLDLYMKAYWHGFPWSHRVKTRVGWGFGVSLADRVPYQERISLEARERQTSKLLNYLDPSIEVSLGDLIGRTDLRETYIGLGISHRSGIFASAKLLGEVNGGSNYIYASLESRF